VLLAGRVCDKGSRCFPRLPHSLDPAFPTRDPRGTPAAYVRQRSASALGVAAKACVELRRCSCNN
jgi:hypothetical protein